MGAKLLTVASVSIALTCLVTVVLDVRKSVAYIVNVID